MHLAALTLAVVIACFAGSVAKAQPTMCDGAKRYRLITSSLALAGGGLLLGMTAFGSYSRIDGRAPPTEGQLGVGIPLGIAALALGTYDFFAKSALEQLGPACEPGSARSVAVLEFRRRRLRKAVYRLSMAAAGLILFAVGQARGTDNLSNVGAGVGVAFVVPGVFSLIPPRWERRRFRGR